MTDSPTDRDPRAERLREVLGGPLPGHDAHRTVLPPGMEPAIPPEDAEVLLAAVLLALHPGGKTHVAFPLIRRPESMARHAGQISLPGGVLESGEGVVQAALRESREEIGLDPADVRILGHLTPVYIPVTRYRVQPIVGWVAERPRYRPAEDEVLGILLADPDRLAAAGARARVEHVRGGRSWDFPAYDVEGQRVWGATAQMLAEFLVLWGRI